MIQPPCPTRWIVRTAALHGILDQYKLAMEGMEEVNKTTRDEYGIKAAGVLTALDKFSTFLGLRLGHLRFTASEERDSPRRAVFSGHAEVVLPAPQE